MADIYVTGVEELKNIVIEEMGEGKVISIYLDRFADDLKEDYADGNE